MFLYITEQAEIWENEQTDILKQKSILEGGDKVAHDEEERSWIFLLWTTVTLSENAKLVASVIMTLGFLGGSVVKNPPDKQEMQVQSLGWEDPLEKEVETHSRILAWEIPWTEESTVHGVAKNQTQLSN